MYNSPARPPQNTIELVGTLLLAGLNTIQDATQIHDSTINYGFKSKQEYDLIMIHDESPPNTECKERPLLSYADAIVIIKHSYYELLLYTLGQGD